MLIRTRRELALASPTWRPGALRLGQRTAFLPNTKPTSHALQRLLFNLTEEMSPLRRYPPLSPTHTHILGRRWGQRSGLVYMARGEETRTQPTPLSHATGHCQIENSDLGTPQIHIPPLIYQIFSCCYTKDPAASERCDAISLGEHSPCPTCVSDKLLSRGRLWATPWTAARQAPLSLGFSKNSGVDCHALLQGIFPTQGSNPCLLCLLHWQEGSLCLI